jgi:hypothetical protein
VKLSFCCLGKRFATLLMNLPNALAVFNNGSIVVGAGVVGAIVVGAIVVGAGVVAFAVVGAIVVGAGVVAFAVVGAIVVGAGVVAFAVVGAIVVGAGVVVCNRLFIFFSIFCIFILHIFRQCLVCIVNCFLTTLRTDINCILHKKMRKYYYYKTNYNNDWIEYIF